MIELLFKDPVLYIITVVVVIISIVLHELGHGWAAMDEGDDTPKKSGHLTLNPVVHMGGVSLILLLLTGIAWGQMPVDPRKFRSGKWGDIFVSAAGPMMNLLLGLLGLVVLKIIYKFKQDQVISYVWTLSMFLQFLYLIAQNNFALFMLNLLPIAPLDGFHIFSQIFPKLKRLNEGPMQFLLIVLFMSGALGYLFKIADWLIMLFLKN